ncbi:hypothetical protein H4R33_000238 [Dimargaris cristalligena]|uniref:Uncharacterized protein n=1 Tax=Dimargaris cristalligena TaxID=215637 RepID=A0A4V1J429_9FUNG|nr:hypothetical protein H4R33_000238 [Dimargaris cristalligena]RKP34119.1 hypothetical protein BJ085DRAFT_39439 [Dimargaris cristalligena]|eukprot:RKP34119.1 hypothetical protein BJ085DRAFT_39439 [Dimargaris cristalligena]
MGVSKPPPTLSSASFHHATPVIAPPRSPLFPRSSGRPTLTSPRLFDGPTPQVPLRASSTRPRPRSPTLATSPTSPHLFSSSLAALNHSLTNLSLPRSTAALSPTTWSTPLEALIAPSRRSSLFNILPQSTSSGTSLAQDGVLKRKSHRLYASLPRLLAAIPHEYTSTQEVVHKAIQKRVPKIVADKRSLLATSSKVNIANSNLEDTVRTVQNLRRLEHFQTISLLLYRSLQTLESIKGT